MNVLCCGPLQRNGKIGASPGLLSVSPKSMRPSSNAVLHTAHDQPDAVHARFAPPWTTSTASSRKQTWSGNEKPRRSLDLRGFSLPPAYFGSAAALPQ